MLTAELLKPNRLNSHGRLWERGKPVPVGMDLARKLHGDPRFRINGLFEALDAAQADTPQTGDVSQLGLSTRPADTAALHELIRAAVGELDVDAEGDFTADGDPDLVALNRILGFEVSAEELAAALKPAPRGVIEAVGDSTVKKAHGVRIMKKSAPTPPPAATEQHDPTTENAVEL